MPNLIGVFFLLFFALTTGSKCPQDLISKYVVCYYKGETSINNLDICNCTHLIFINAVKKADNFSLDATEDAKKDLETVKEKKSNLVVLFTLEAKEEESSSILKSENRSQELMNGIMDFLQETDFDGIELNFKFSSQDGASKESYASFVKDLSKTLSSSHRRVKRDGYDVIEKLQDDVTTASYSTQSPKNSTSKAPSLKQEIPKSNRTTRDEKEESAEDDENNDFLTLEENTTTILPKEEENEKEEQESPKDEITLNESNKFVLFVRLSIQPEIIAKKFDLKVLSKYADALTVPTHNIVNKNEEHLTYHPSRLMGLSDILNTDSILDFLTGMGALKSKIIISIPATVVKFQLEDEGKNTPRSPSISTPQLIDQSQLCLLLSKNNWTLERDEDLTAPYAFSGKTWLAFEDEVSVKIKGKYILLRELGGGAIYPIDADVNDESCTNQTGSGGYLTGVLYKNFRSLGRKPRALVLESLQEEIQDNSFSTIEAGVKLSEYRIVRVVDHSGAVHVIRKNTKTEFQCSRQGYFSHPLGCNRFYRCVKFDQYSDEFTVFEYNCPAGLAFDERWEVCVWPGSLPHGAPCTGSSEIAPVPRSHYQCPNQEGYYADPENCRWFFACLDHARDGITPLTAYEFRCPFGLVFNQEKLACDWPWIVGACGSRGAVNYVAAQTVGYSTGVHSATFINGGNLAASFGQFNNFGEEASFNNFGRGFDKTLKEGNGNSERAQTPGFGYIASQFDDKQNRAPFASLPDYEISGGRILNKGGVVLDQHINFGSAPNSAAGALGGGYGYQSLNSDGGFGGKSSSSNTYNVIGNQRIGSYSKDSISQTSGRAFKGESLSTLKPFSVHVPSVQINEEKVAEYSFSRPASEATVGTVSFGSGSSQTLSTLPGETLGISVTQPTVSIVTPKVGIQIHSRNFNEQSSGFSYSTPLPAHSNIPSVTPTPQVHRFGQSNFGSITAVNVPSDSGKKGVSGAALVTPQTVNQGYQFSSRGSANGFGLGQSNSDDNLSSPVVYVNQPAVTAPVTSEIISGSTPATLIPNESLKPVIQPQQSVFGKNYDTFGSSISSEVFSGSTPATLTSGVSLKPAIQSQQGVFGKNYGTFDSSTAAGVFSPGSTPVTLTPGVSLKPIFQSEQDIFGKNNGVFDGSIASGVFSKSTPPTVVEKVNLKPAIQSVQNVFNGIKGNFGAAYSSSPTSRLSFGSTPATSIALKPVAQTSSEDEINIGSVNPSVLIANPRVSVSSADHEHSVYNSSSPQTPINTNSGLGISIGHSALPVVTSKPLSYSFEQTKILGVKNDYGKGEAITLGYPKSAFGGLEQSSIDAEITRELSLNKPVGSYGIPVVAPKVKVQSFKSAGSPSTVSPGSIQLVGSGVSFTTPKPQIYASSQPTISRGAIQLVGSGGSFTTPKPQIYASSQPTAVYETKSTITYGSSVTPKIPQLAFNYQSGEGRSGSAVAVNLPSFTPKTVTSFESTRVTSDYSPLGINIPLGAKTFTSQSNRVNEFSTSGSSVGVNSPEFTTIHEHSGIRQGSGISFSAPIITPKVIQNNQVEEVLSNGPGILVSSPTVTPKITESFGSTRSGQTSDYKYSVPSFTSSQELDLNSFSFKSGENNAGGLPVSTLDQSINLPTVPKTIASVEHFGNVGISYSSPQVPNSGTTKFGFENNGISVNNPSVSASPSLVNSFDQTLNGKLSGVEIPLASPKAQINILRQQTLHSVDQESRSFGSPVLSNSETFSFSKASGPGLSGVTINKLVQPQFGGESSYSTNFKQTGGEYDSARPFNTLNKTPKQDNVLSSGKPDILTHVSIEQQPVISVGTISSINFDQASSTLKPFTSKDFSPNPDQEQIIFKSSYSVQPKQIITETTPAPVVSITPSTQVYFQSSPQPPTFVKTVSALPNAEENFGGLPNQNSKSFTSVTTPSTFQRTSNFHLHPVKPGIDILAGQPESFSQSFGADGGHRSFPVKPDDYNFNFGNPESKVKQIQTLRTASTFAPKLNEQNFKETTGKPFITHSDFSGFSDSGGFNSVFESTKTYLSPDQSTTNKPTVVIHQQPVQIISQKTFGQKQVIQPFYEQPINVDKQNTIPGFEQQAHNALGIDNAFPGSGIFNQKQYLPPVTQKSYIPPATFTTVKPSTVQQPFVYSERILPVIPTVKTFEGQSDSNENKFLPFAGVLKQTEKSVFVKQQPQVSAKAQDINLLYPVTTQSPVTSLTEEISIQQNTNFDFQKVKGGQGAYIQPGINSTPKTSVFLPASNQNFSFASGFKYSINPNIEIPEPPQEYLLSQNILSTRKPNDRVNLFITSSTPATLDNYKAPNYLPPGGFRKTSSKATVISVGANQNEDNAEQFLNNYSGGFGDFGNGNNQFIKKVINGDNKDESEFGREGSSSTISYEVTTAKPRQRGRGRQYHGKLTSSAVPAKNKYEEYEIEREGQRNIDATDSTKTTIDLKNLKVEKNKKTVIVVSQVSDANPILIGKLAGQCSCQSNMLEVKGKGRKSGRGRGTGQAYQQPPINEYLPPNQDTVDVTPGAVVVGGGVLNNGIAYQPEQSVVSSTTAAYPEVTSPSVLSSLGPDGVLPITPKFLLSEDGIRNKKKQFRGKTRYLPPTPGLSADGIPLSPVLASEIASTVDYNVLKGDESRTQNEIGGAYPGAAFDRYGPGGWRGFDETLQGSVDCKRPGLFRHPKYCNKFYACNYDPWKERYTLHVFNCPIHLTYDSSISACNWPIRGPACADDNLLV